MRSLHGESQVEQTNLLTLLHVPWSYTTRHSKFCTIQGILQLSLKTAASALCVFEAFSKLIWEGCDLTCYQYL